LILRYTTLLFYGLAKTDAQVVCCESVAVERIDAFRDPVYLSHERLDCEKVLLLLSADAQPPAALRRDLCAVGLGHWTPIRLGVGWQEDRLGLECT